MPEKAEKSDQMFLAEFQKLLRKRSKSPLMAEPVQADSKSVGKESSLKNNDLYAGLPPDTESLLSLITRPGRPGAAGRGQRVPWRAEAHPGGRVIRDARKRQGLTVETLADLAKAEASTLVVEWIKGVSIGVG